MDGRDLICEGRAGVTVQMSLFNYVLSSSCNKKLRCDLCFLCLFRSFKVDIQEQFGIGGTFFSYNMSIRPVQKQN